MHTQYLPKSSIYIHFDGPLVEQECSTLLEHWVPQRFRRVCCCSIFSLV